jgi:hypothetical protein
VHRGPALAIGPVAAQNPFPPVRAWCDQAVDSMPHPARTLNFIRESAAYAQTGLLDTHGGRHYVARDLKGGPETREIGLPRGVRGWQRRKTTKVGRTLPRG